MAKKKQQESGAVVPRIADVEGIMAPRQKQAEQSVEFCEGLEITSAEDRAVAEKVLATVATTHKAWDDERKSLVEPLKGVTSKIDGMFRPVLQALKKCETICKGKLGAWDVEQAQARAKLLKASTAAAAAGDQAAAAKAYGKAEAHVVEQGTATSKIVWTGEVVDAAAIPREYMVPDVAKLEAITRATGADPKIPGWRAFETAEIRTSRRGVA